MDLSLTPFQEMVKNSAKEFLEREYPRATAIEVDDSELGFSPELWRQMVEMGWVSMILPEEYGGQASTLTDLGVLYEELGRSAFSSPHHSSVVLGGLTILEAGSAEQRRTHLPSIAEGERIVALALSEPDYGWGPDSVRLQATRRDGNFVLNGTKLFVHDAQVADQLVVVARTRESANPENGITLFLIDKGIPGVSARILEGWTGDKVNEVKFENVEVPASAVLGDVDGGWSPLDRALDKATVVLCAYMVGGTQFVYELAVDYSRNRVQFGVPIGTFQRVQDMVIDIVNGLEAARWTTYEALWKVDENKDDASQAVSIAKAVTSEAFYEGCDKSHDVHAGIGISKTYGLYLYTKKARTYYAYLGDPDYHKHRVAKLLKL